MFTVKYPELMPVVKSLLGGLISFKVANDELPILVIKVPKEYILSAKIKKFIKIYLVPIEIKKRRTYGLVTAFFDDDDEPLVVKTPIFKDDIIDGVLNLLGNENIEVYFFDELSRERLFYQAKVVIPEATQMKMGSMHVLTADLPMIKDMIEQMEISFGRRSRVDDEQAISILMNESICLESVFIQDIRPENHLYHGARGYSHTMLEREEPGSYQEEDIIQCLLMVFNPGQIYLGPKRVYDKEEMCDILIVTDSNVVVIQAKDSPNIERINRQKLERKRKNAVSALKKAIAQVKGAIGYYRRDNSVLEFLIGDVHYSINIELLKIRTIIIVKELFDDQYYEYSTSTLEILHSKDVPCIPLDYPNFYQFCKNSPSEADFIDTYDDIMKWATDYGQYPKPRFGLVE